MSRTAVGVLALAGMSALSTLALAAKVDISKNPPLDVGPPTTYGETPAEAANKRIMFEFVHMNMVQRKPKEAFEKYVSKDYCNHGHLSTRGQKECSGYDETIGRWIMNYSKPVTPGETIEMPTIATVNGEMVTMYGEGVDIFRVHNGKITDHWDASPPAEAKLGAHIPEFAVWANSPDRKGPPPKGPDEPKPHVVVTQALLDKVDVGPVTPYGETAKEAEAKRIVFEAAHMQFLQGKPRAAVEKYYSKDYCGHGHLTTRGLKECGDYQQKWSEAKDSSSIPKIGDVIEVPTMASVNGEMVSMYGAGVDIFQVRDGKIIAHWDASPPVAITIKAHTKEFVDNMVKVMAGDSTARVGGPSAANAPANGMSAGK
ncbi:MAG: hypothetical protein QM808_03130 [Steroidobacteraceae bacterium]